MSISNGDMVWIVALNKSKEANMVRCKVDSIVYGLNSAYYNLIATDNPNWNGHSTFSMVKEEIYTSLSRAQSAIEIFCGEQVY